MRYYWTNHARYKMRFYRLSEQMVRSIIHNPNRIEEGIAPGTVAYMRRTGSRKKPHEIWVMITSQSRKSNLKSQKLENKTIRIISAWRYPGITKPGRSLPSEILKEIKEAV